MGRGKKMGRLWFKIESMDQVYEKIEKLSYLNSDATILRTADILDHQAIESVPGSPIFSPHP